MTKVKLNADQQAVLDRNPDLDPRFIPKTWNGMADLDEKIYRTEQAFLEKDKGRQLPAPTSASQRKTSKPAQVITKASLERQLRVICGQLGEWIGRDVIKPFETRLKALEEAPCEFRGPWRQAETPYPYRSLTVHQRNCWFSRVKTSAKPGSNRDWVMVAKKGVVADA